jgi:HEAT repeat protein
LKDEDTYVRGRAVDALGNIGDARAVEPIINALKNDKNWYAAEALGKIGDARAIEALNQALKDSDASVRLNAREALDKIQKR